MKEFMLASSFLYKSFVTEIAAADWILENYERLSYIGDTIQFAKDAKNPLQFIATINSILHCLK